MSLWSEWLPALLCLFIPPSRKHTHVDTHRHDAFVTPLILSLTLKSNLNPQNKWGLPTGDLKKISLHSRQPPQWGQKKCMCLFVSGWISSLWITKWTLCLGALQRRRRECLGLKLDTLMIWRASKSRTPPHLFFFFFLFLLLLRKFVCNQSCIE